MDPNFTETLETKVNHEIKSLTLAQIRELRKAGLDPALNEMTATKNAEMVDWIIANVYPELPDTTPYNEAVDLAVATYKKAYGREEARKN